MDDFFAGDKALADAHLLVKHVEQQLPTLSRSGWCAILKKGLHSLSFTPNEVILRDKMTRGHQLVAIVAMAADNKQEADGHSRWIFTPAQDYSTNGSGYCWQAAPVEYLSRIAVRFFARTPVPEGTLRMAQKMIQATM